MTACREKGVTYRCLCRRYPWQPGENNGVTNMFFSFGGVVKYNGSSWFVGVDFLRESSASLIVNAVIDNAPDAARQRSAIPGRHDSRNGRQEIISIHFRRFRVISVATLPRRDINATCFTQSMRLLYIITWCHVALCVKTSLS